VAANLYISYDVVLTENSPVPLKFNHHLQAKNDSNRNNRLIMKKRATPVLSFIQDFTCKKQSTGNTEVDGVDTKENGFLLVNSHLSVCSQIKQPEIDFRLGLSSLTAWVKLKVRTCSLSLCSHAKPLGQDCEV
jgi:hypothetical protein